MVYVNITCMRETKIMNILGREGDTKREREEEAPYLCWASLEETGISVAVLLLL